MKKIAYTLALIMFVSSLAMAQTEKGSSLMGVQVGNIAIPTSGGSGTIISLQPTRGWFVSDGLAIGAGIPFFYLGSGGTHITQIGLAPFLRYFFGASKTKPFLGASVGVVNTSGGDGSRTNGLYSASGGVAFFLNRNVSFDLGLTYTDGNTVAVNTLFFGGSNGLTPNIPKALNLNLGFQVYFGK